MHLLNTLYVNTQDSYLRLENSTLRVEVDGDVRLRVPLHHLQAVVCFGRVGVSVPVMHRLAEESIALVLLDEGGRFKCRLEGAQGGNVLLRMAQHRRAGDEAFRLSLARACIAGKIKNGRQLLLRGARESKSADECAHLGRRADDLAASLRALPGARDMDTLRGLEGEAARQYFDGLPCLVRSDQRDHFQMNGRSRRPPRDRLNAILSFLYSMWMNDCRSALEGVGLDPQIGFLHAIRPGRASLALDLMEEFRPLADRLALTMINRHQLCADDFLTREGDSVSLTEAARRAVVVAFQERKQERVSHPLSAQPIALGLVPIVQARLIARSVRSDSSDATGQIGTNGYVPYLVR